MMIHQFEPKERSVLIGVLVCLLGLVYLLYDDSLLMDSLSEQTMTPIGQVIPITNDVRHKQNQDFQWRNVRRKKVLGWGDGVFTGAKSQAVIELNDGSEVTLAENSLVIFTPNQKDMTLDLKFGSVKSRIANNKSLTVQVEGETLNLSGQNAIVEIGKKSGESMAIKVVSGELNIEDKNKTKQRVIAGGVAKPVQKPTPKPTPQPTPTPSPTPTPEPTPVLPDSVGIDWTNPPHKSEYPINLDLEGKPIDKARVQFNWIEPSTNGIMGKGFDIQISKDQSFQNLIEDQSITKNQANFEFMAEGKYYARVRVKLDPEDEKLKSIKTPWSLPLEVAVTTKEAPALEAPVLATPQVELDGDQQKSAELKWTRVKGASLYKIEFSKSAAFGPKTESQDLDDNKLNFQPNQGGQVFYRVRGLTKAGKRGLASMTGSIFTKISKPQLMPIESISKLGLEPKDPPAQVELKMVWSKVMIAQGYEVNIAQNPEFKDPVSFNTRSTKGALKINKPGTHYVRVRALNGVSEPISSYSNVEKFIYEYRIPLSRPILKEPMNNVTLFFQNNDTTFWFGWSLVKQATSYQVEVATDAEFQKTVVTAKSESNRYLNRQALSAGKLFWRVKAENSERESQWSEVRSITIFYGRKAQEGGE